MSNCEVASMRVFIDTLFVEQKECLDLLCPIYDVFVEENVISEELRSSYDTIFVQSVTGRRSLLLVNGIDTIFEVVPNYLRNIDSLVSVRKRYGFVNRHWVNQIDTEILEQIDANSTLAKYIKIKRYKPFSLLSELTNRFLQENNELTELELSMLSYSLFVDLVRNECCENCNLY